MFLFLAKFGLPAAKKAMDERTAKIQGDLDAAEQAKTDAEAVKADYEAKLADAKTESARIIEEARQAADQLKSDQQARLNEELAAARAAAQADIDAAKGQAMAELRGEVADIAIGAAEAVVGANLDRNAQVQLIEDYINRVGTHRRAAELIMATERDTAYAKALLAVASAEGDLATVQDEIFTLARAIGGNDELGVDAVRRRRIPAARRQQIVEDLLAGRASKTTIGLVSMIVATGRARDLAGIADALVALGAAEGGKQVAVVRSAVELTDDQKTRLAAALQRSVGIAGRRPGRHRPVRARWPRRPDRRHGHRRLGPPPPRPAQASHLNTSKLLLEDQEPPMTDLNINAGDIAAAIRKNLEGFDPSIGKATVGRVAEVGDGIARVTGLPGCAVNELLEFEDGTKGLALNLDEESIGAVVLGEVDKINEGQAVKATGEILSVPCGDGLLGRVVDALGLPVDGKGPLQNVGDPPHGDPGARHHGPQAGARAAPDRHQGHRLDDPHRPWPAGAHHRRPQDRQDHRRDRHHPEPEGSRGEVRVRGHRAQRSPPSPRR